MNKTKVFHSGLSDGGVSNPESVVLSVDEY